MQFTAKFVSLLAAIAGQTAISFPDTPFRTEGRFIKSASGVNVNFAGVNWPGAADTMLPEGLQYASIHRIVSMVKGLGMNVVRLTYAIEMIDDIFNNDPNQSLNGTLVQALGYENGTTVLQKILHYNPQFNASTTRLQVFDAVAQECATQEIWVHLDNHMSKAEWCCSPEDGNGWFEDTYFDVYKWQRGLGYMANHAKSWTALSSMALRNELRQVQGPGNATAEPYDWATWYQNMIPSTHIINSNNSLPLIFLSGLTSDIDLSDIVNGVDLGDGQRFDVSSYPYADKLIYELHNYQNSANSCVSISEQMYQGGYNAMNTTGTPIANAAPVIMTEFGFNQIDGSNDGVYAQCLNDALLGQSGGPGGWMYWVLVGSYYVREGIQDSDEVWGLLNHNWTGWRNQSVIDGYFRPFVKATTHDR